MIWPKRGILIYLYKLSLLTSAAVSCVPLAAVRFGIMLRFRVWNIRLEFVGEVWGFSCESLYSGKVKCKRSRGRQCCMWLHTSNDGREAVAQTAVFLPEADTEFVVALRYQHGKMFPTIKEIKITLCSAPAMVTKKSPHSFWCATGMKTSVWLHRQDMGQKVFGCTVRIRDKRCLVAPGR